MRGLGFGPRRERESPPLECAGAWRLPVSPWSGKCLRSRPERKGPRPRRTKPKGNLKLSTEALLPTLRVIYRNRKRRFWDLMMMSRKIPMIIVKEVIIW